MAQLLQIDHYPRISEFERGRRIPSLTTLLYYARLAGIPLESIVDDEIDMQAFRKQLAIADSKRGELNQPDSTEQPVVLFWRTSSTSDQKNDYKYPPCPGCGGSLEKNEVSGRYLCGDCDGEWEAWEVMDSNF